MNKAIQVLLLVFIFVIPNAQAQFASVGGGVLLSDRSLQPVAELNAQSPPFFDSRAYITLSWTDQSIKPTIISAAEKPALYYGQAFTSIGAGLLWLEVNDYKPYPMLVSSTIIPIMLPRTSFVVIGSTLPFQKFDWSVVLKVGVNLIFIK